MRSEHTAQNANRNRMNRIRMSGMLENSQALNIEHFGIVRYHSINLKTDSRTTTTQDRRHAFNRMLTMLEELVSQAYPFISLHSQVLPFSRQNRFDRKENFSLSDEMRCRRWRCFVMVI